MGLKLGDLGGSGIKAFSKKNAQRIFKSFKRNFSFGVELQIRRTAWIELLFRLLR